MFCSVPGGSYRFPCCRSCEVFNKNFRNSFCCHIRHVISFVTVFSVNESSHSRRPSELGASLWYFHRACIVFCIPPIMFLYVFHREVSLLLTTLLSPYICTVVSLLSSRACFVKRTHFPWFLSFLVCCDVFSTCWSVHD